LLVHLIDELEGKSLAVQPFVRLFAIYTQFVSTLVLVVILTIFALPFFPPPRDEIWQVLAVYVIAIAMIFVVAFMNAVIGKLNRASAATLAALTAIHVIANAEFIALGVSYAVLAVVGFPAKSDVVIRSSVAVYIFGACVLIGLLFLFYLYGRVYLAIRTMFRLSNDDRALMVRLPAATTSWGKFWSWLNIVPPTFQFIGFGPRAILTLILAQVSALLLALAGILFLWMPIRLGLVTNTIVISCFNNIPEPRQEGCAIGAFLGAGLQMLLALPVLLLFGLFVEKGVRRLLRLSLERLQRVDPRPPILFLRAFKDDQIDLRPAKLSWLGWLAEFGNRATNLDRVLLEEGTPYGPVVAIGNPKDQHPPYGAARGYFDNQTWQQAVSALAHAAAAIVICVDNTEGIWWETDHLASNNLLGKTLFVIHPRHTDKEKNLEFAAEICRIMGHDPSSIEFGSTPTFGLFLDSQHTVNLAQSSTFSQIAITLVLRLFLRPKLGSRSIPLHPFT
jgi:hypothetical protein